MDARNSLFGQGPRGGGRVGIPSNPGASRSQSGTPQAPMNPQPSPRMPSYGQGQQQPAYGNQSYQPSGSQQPQRSYPPASRGPAMELRLWKLEDKNLQSLYIFGNICAVSPSDFPGNRDGTDIHLKLSGPQIRGEYVVTARPTQGFPPGCIAMSDPQRSWAGIAMTDTVRAEMYDPFERGGKAYLGSIDVEIGFASTRKTSTSVYDQETLSDLFLKTYQNQILAPGQRLIMDFKNIPLLCIVSTVQLVDLSMEKQGDAGAPTITDPNARGILTNVTDISFHKDPKGGLNLKGSTKRNANPILRPDFKFEDMGIGGLDAEFSTIFRRAFASRIFPPALIDQLGIMHVKGVLLYGPPGTGKTLIARQIGKMLQAREPKVINGPEVLNKYVGQSEENIRKLFADAEKEYKEKGDESGLHIIIFDELDAVCKQRGSGAGGGTGVGDSVVNQLLSKLDGVDQLNNILLIGMTNRKDMIDDALLRPGRLEVQVEISLPDEAGRQQILKIHTAKMRDNGKLASDIDLGELASLTKNFSGAELNGLTKSAASFAFNRHTAAGTMASVSADVSNLIITRADFMAALAEVVPAFGVSDDELTKAIKYGIINYSPSVQTIFNNCMVHVERLETSRQTCFSMLFHGPDGSGKTAMAAHVAKTSGFPFIKILTPDSLVGFRDEIAKKDHIHKAFTDAYKSPLSILIIDNIERIIEWNPVGPRMSNIILQALQTLIQTDPPKNHRLLIIGTTSRRGVLEQLDFASVFSKEIAVPAVGQMRDLDAILRSQNVFSDERSLVEAMNLVNEYSNGSNQVGVGIKKILDVAETTKGLEEDMKASWFAENLGTLIARQ